MSLTFTSKTANEGDFTPAFTTASVSMAAGSVCLLVVAWLGVSVGADPAATGLTFTQVVNGSNGFDRTIALYRALIPGGGFSDVITIGTGGDPHVQYYSVIEVTGAAITGSNASGAIIQSQGFSDGGPANPYTNNYASGFSSSTNGGYAAFSMFTGDLHPFTARSGWTKGAEGIKNCDFWRSSSDTAAGFTATVGPTALVGVMVEVAVASTAVIDDDVGFIVPYLTNPTKIPPSINTVFA